MSERLIADWRLVGMECSQCAQPIRQGQEVDVETDDETGHTQTVTHAPPCPEEEP